MIDNSGLFNKLLDDGSIRVHDSPLFHEPLTPLPSSFSFDRIEGMLLGVAIGDALGVPTDDTQLTFWTLEQLIQDNGLIPDNLARSFCRRRIIGLGSTVHEFIRNYKDRGKAWYVCGPDSLGNGALMRISPLLLPYLLNPHVSLSNHSQTLLWPDTVNTGLAEWLPSHIPPRSWPKPCRM
jgi:hypothetical protein